MGADSVKFGAQNVSFGMLVVPNSAPWVQVATRPGRCSFWVWKATFQLFMENWENAKTCFLDFSFPGGRRRCFFSSFQEKCFAGPNF